MSRLSTSTKVLTFYNHLGGQRIHSFYEQKMVNLWKSNIGEWLLVEQKSTYDDDVAILTEFFIQSLFTIET